MTAILEQPMWLTLKEDTGRVSLHAMAWALNRLNLSWDDGDEWPARVGLPASGLGMMPAMNPAYRWATAEAMRQGILWAKVCPMEGTDHPLVSLDQIARLVHRAAIAHLELVPADIARVEAGGSISDFVFPGFAPQFLLSRSSALRTGQAIWMFDEAPARRAARIPAFPSGALRDCFTRALGMPVRDFVRILMLLYGASNSAKPMLMGDMYRDQAAGAGLRLWTEENGVRRSRLPNVLEILAATPAKMQKWMTSAARLADGAAIHELLYAPNPLLRFPLVHPFLGDADRCFAPVPSLLLEWLYEPLIGYLHDSLPRDLQCPHYGHLFEEYVGMLLDRHAPGGARWLSEVELGPVGGGKVVDWARAFSDTVVLVDAKRCFIDPAKRYRFDADDWKSLEKGLTAGVEQGAAFWKSVRRGDVPALAIAKQCKALLVLVSEGDTSLVGNQEEIEASLKTLAETRCPGMTVLLLSLDQLQHLMINWLVADLEWLPATLWEIAARGRKHVEEAAPHRAEGPLFDAVADIFQPELL
jgi:hypothetical protein